ncbi:MAG: restriction endonuclease [Gammaproteobacteria bacterium]|nr:restriction endonuclease [Gammaproteobacteria bacterium]
MPIPKYHEIIPPVLAQLAKPDIGTIKWKELEVPLAKLMGLSQEELITEYESGNGRIFLDRISWALTYLSIAKLIERPKRGYCKITELGLSLVGDEDRISLLVKEKFAEHEAQKKAKKDGLNADEISTDLNSEITPDEALNQAANSIRDNVYEDILDTILSKSPYEFEKLVVKLLDKMGYGGLVKDAGQVTQQSNDGGIDGIIKEDLLGLGRIHIQAKRYKRENSIGREDVQKFVGALAVAQSNKGVFITTSSYSKGALEYADSLNGTTNVVLIDGSQLAEYIYDFGLGMQTEQTVVIKRMDSDFWEKMQDDS